MSKLANTIRLSHITSASDLCEEIKRLETLKEVQEEMLADNLQNLSHSLQPDVMLKGLFSKIKGEGDLKQNALKTSLDLGAQFLLDKIMMRKGVGIKGFFLNMALKKVASFLIEKSSVPIFGK